MTMVLMQIVKWHEWVGETERQRKRDVDETHRMI